MKRTETETKQDTLLVASARLQAMQVTAWRAKDTQRVNMLDRAIMRLASKIKD